MVEVRREKGAGAKHLDVLIKGMNGKQGKVGWFPSATYPDGTPTAYVASIQEFGSPTQNIPPRLGLRVTIMEKRNGWAGIVKDGSKAILNGGRTPQQVMQGLTTQALGNFKAHFASVTDPPLSDLTLLLRKYKRGLFKEFPNPGPVTGKTLGMLWSMYMDGEIDTTGVSVKPLNDTGYMIATMEGQVE